MTYPDEHRRLAPVLEMARRLDIATNPDLAAIFEAGTAGFQIWCTPDDQPTGWQDAHLTAGAFSKPCGYVASVCWGWEGETIAHLILTTDAYDTMQAKTDREYYAIHNRPSEIAWAKRKIRWLFKKAGVPCPPIVVEE